jgi:hypothetical protein
MSKHVTPLKRRKVSNAKARKVLEQYMAGKMHASQLLECECGNSVETGPDCDKVVCSACVQKQVAPPSLGAVKVKKPKGTGKRGRPRKNPPKVKSGFPRGWHFRKEYVHTDGTVWQSGKRVETKEVKKLRKAAKELTEL